jgi:AGZA family xanthine/uracil permease-like MFS transporter
MGNGGIAMQGYRWLSRGDINAFFGLMLDNVAVLIFLVSLLSSSDPMANQQFSGEFVLTQMVPGTVLGVVVGDLTYTWLAFRLARRTGRADVTAMPLGLDTPSTFAVSLLVLLPTLREALRQGMDHPKAMVYAWHVGAMVLVLCGLFKALCAPFGNAVRRLVPRAGLLGSLTAIALVLIAFIPLWREIAAVPPLGILALTVVLVSLVAHHELPFRIPGALAALAVGIVVAISGRYLGNLLDLPLIPPIESAVGQLARQPFELLPEFTRNAAWWSEVGWSALGQLPVVLPFALATVVGGIDCTESAAATGDEYDTGSIVLTEGLASIVAGLCGGVIQNTPYIGHPAYKAMNARAGYTLATALFIGAAGSLGWFLHLFDWLPQAALMPILVFVGVEITAQSFRATPVRHYPALALAVLPALAYLAMIAVDQALGGRAAAEPATVLMHTLRCLANGFVITSLLWSAALAEVLESQFKRAAGWLVVASLCAFVGVIHSPVAPARIAWPWDVMADITNVRLRYQSPYHWAVAYLLAAGLLLVLAVVGKKAPVPTKDLPSDGERAV